MGNISSKPTPMSVEDLLKQEESDTVEFKSSVYYSYNSGVPEKIIKDSFLKTIAGFLNTRGGTLGVGIADNGDLLGIHPDLQKKYMDIDHYVNSLTSLIKHSLGSLATTRVNVQIAIVHVLPSPEPIYAHVSKGNQIFYVRMNNSTRQIEGRDLVEYIKHHC